MSQEENQKNVPELEDDTTTKVFEVKDVTCKNGHTFKYSSSRTVVCECGVGYELTNGMTVMDGHIYEGENLII